MSQTSYSYNLPSPWAGVKVDASDDVVDSLINQESTLEIPFGVAVKFGTTDNTCKLPAAAGDNVKLMGIALFSNTYSPLSLGTTGIKPKNMVNVLARGRVWVTTEEAVAKGDVAYVRYGAGGGGSQLGAIRKSADTATATKVAGARFATTTSGSGLCQLDVDFNAVRGILG